MDEGAGVGIKIISYTISRMAVPPADFPRVTPLGVHHLKGNNVELCAACGQYFQIGTMVVTDPGDSDIMKSMNPTEATA